MNRFLLSALCLLGVFVLGQPPGHLHGLASGSFYLATSELASAPSFKNYKVTLNGNLGNGSLGYALGLAGFQAVKKQAQLTVLVNSVKLVDGNTGMSLKLQFSVPKKTASVWLRLKWSYLVVSSTMETTYSNIWATNVELQFQKDITDKPIDQVGTAFLAVGGDVGDCDIFVEPLLQLDIPHCLAVPANGQYIGGRPIIHAYISGFSVKLLESQNQTVSISKGNLSNPYSDSDGWEIVYSSSLPNGPKVSVQGSRGLDALQVSFVFVRMDFYARGYPLNSQLQYSSSHVFTVVGEYNREVVLERGDATSYNQNYFRLPDSSYLFYGISSFSLNSETNSSLFSLMVNMGKGSYWAISPGLSVQSLTLSADIFIRNVMQLCSSKQKELALLPTLTKSVITPKIAAYTAVEVTQLLPLSELTSNSNAVVYRLGVASSVSKQLVTFTKLLTFTAPASSGYLRVEMLLFQKMTACSLVEGSEYAVKMAANGQEILAHRFLYKNNPKGFFKSPVFYKAFRVLASAVSVEVTVSFSSNSMSQELYILLAATYQAILYDPASAQCVASCPGSASGVSGEGYPLTCVYCKLEAGFVFSIASGTCVCKKGTYLDIATMSCQSCGVNCDVCDPNNATNCLLCAGEAQLVNGLCGCQNGQYLTPRGCVGCPLECSSCLGPNGLCLTCKSGIQNVAQNCRCASGFFNVSSNNCGVCKSRCMTCNQTDDCLSCNPNDHRLLSNSSCVCKQGHYQSSAGVCQMCASTCLSCSGAAGNCSSCDESLNRMLMGGECLCLAGFTEAGLQCVMSNCSSNPLCAVCANVSATQTMCIQCVANLFRVLNPLTSQCDCINGYFSQSGICKPCGKGCQLCTSLTNCSSCATLATPRGDGSCVCPQTTYLALSAEGIYYCQNCGPLCVSCKNQTFCLTCKSNSAAESGVCSCVKGYFLNSTDKECQLCGLGCRVCNSDGCISCNPPLLLSQGVCQEVCTKGYRQEGDICVPCVSNCSVCLNQHKCANCQASFFLNNGQCVLVCPPGSVSFVNKQQIALCQLCAPLCATCANTRTFCTSCNNATYLFMSAVNQTCLYSCPDGTLTDGKNCLPCDSSCASCGGSTSYCLKCSGPLILYRGSCLQTCPGIVTSSLKGRECLDSCPQGSFLFENNCSACHSQCSSCEVTALNCTSCKSGVLADYGVCVNSCASNQFISGGVCYNCSHNCMQCFRKADYCVKCSPGLILSAGRCIFSCASDQYYNATVGLCMSCKRGCGSCVNESECLTCKTPGVVPANGKCPFCANPCMLCGSDGRCLRCTSSTYLFNGACLASCPGITVPINGLCSCPIGVLHDGVCVSACGSGSFNSNGICELCDTNCFDCTGNSTTCVSCFYGWTLSNGKCLAGTGCRYGQQLVNGLCAAICTNSSLFLEGVCFVDKCKEGYYPNGYGGCARMGLYECKEGEYYYQGNCLASCPAAFYADAYSKQCLGCPSNCESCVSTVECYTCARNYLNIDGVCYMSNCGNGFVSVGSSCARSCPVGSKKQGNVCVRRCEEQSYFYKDYCYLECPTGSNNGFGCIQPSV